MVALFAVPGMVIIYIPVTFKKTSVLMESLSVFFICFRETIETGIIVSVLLAFIKQTLGHEQDAVTYKKLVRQVCSPKATGKWSSAVSTVDTQ